MLMDLGPEVSARSIFASDFHKSVAADISNEVMRYTALVDKWKGCDYLMRTNALFRQKF
jgi:hypothetical protein